MVSGSSSQAPTAEHTRAETASAARISHSSPAGSPSGHSSSSSRPSTYNRKEKPYQTIRIAPPRFGEVKVKRSVEFSPSFSVICPHRVFIVTVIISSRDTASTTVSPAQASTKVPVPSFARIKFSSHGVLHPENVAKDFIIVPFLSPGKRRKTPCPGAIFYLCLREDPLSRSVWRRGNRRWRLQYLTISKDARFHRHGIPRQGSDRKRGSAGAWRIVFWHLSYRADGSYTEKELM